MNEKNEGTKAKELAIMLACVIYIISPIDFMPDVFPIIGWVDDVGALGYLGKTLLSYCKKA